MKLTKRNDIYVLDYRDALGKRKRVSLKTKDKTEAEAKAREYLSQNNSTARKSGWTLANALDHTNETIWQHQNSWQSKQSVIRTIKADIGHKKLTEIDYQLLTNFVTVLRDRGLSRATINRRLAAISKALGEAAKLGHIQTCPPIPKQPEDNKRTRFLSGAEEERLLASCSILSTPKEVELMRSLIIFLVDTGARRSEALAVHPEHVDAQSVLLMFTKSTIDKPKHRRVPLTARAKAAANVIAKANEDGTMWGVYQFEGRVRRVIADSGIKDFKVHDLRHTCASRLIQRGAQLHEVREWLGHSSVVVTERYAHLADSSLTHLTSLLQ